MSTPHHNNVSSFVMTHMPLEAMETMLRQIVKEELERGQKQQLQDKLLTTEEACQLFQPAVSRQTLNNWSKEGKLQQYRIGRSVFYKYSEIMEAGKTLQKYRRTLTTA